MTHFCEACGVKVDVPGLCSACDPNKAAVEPPKPAAPPAGAKSESKDSKPAPAERKG